MTTIQSALKDLGIQAVNSGGSTGNNWWSGPNDRPLLQSINPATGEAIAGVSPWYLLLWLVPCLNYVAMFILYYGLARNFGRDVLYAIGLFLFGFVFFPLLGYGSDEYRGDYEF